MLDRFAIHQPETVAEASSMLAHYGDDATVYAGGTELLIVMKERLAYFSHLIDIKHISGLNEIAFHEEKRELSIGATARHRDLERSPLLRERIPALAMLEAAVANVRVRAAGTIGGNLCFAEPHSDPATLLTALDAWLTLTSGAGARDVLMEDFITGLMETGRRHDEILTAISVPDPGSHTGIAYERFKLHERPTAAVAAVIAVEDGTIAGARIVAGSVGDRPQRLPQTESFLVNRQVVHTIASAAGDLIRDEVLTIDDAFESDTYKRQLVRVVGRRAIAAAIERAIGDTDGRHAA